MMMTELIECARKHYVKLLSDVLAITMFNPPGSGAMRFKATGEIVIVGNSQAKRFTEKFEMAKEKFLAENNYKAEKSFVQGGYKGTQLTSRSSFQKLRSSIKKGGLRPVGDEQHDLGGQCLFTVPFIPSMREHVPKRSLVISLRSCSRK